MSNLTPDDLNYLPPEDEEEPDYICSDCGYSNCQCDAASDYYRDN